MASELQPEFFSLLGINIFLALSLLTCLFEKNFPTAIPYVYQSASLFGFGQLWISKEFSQIFGNDMRFLYHSAYLSVAVISIAAINLYLALLKKQKVLSWIYCGTVVLPTVTVSIFFISAYINDTPVPLPALPHVPLEMVYILLAPCAAVLGLGILTTLKPEVLKRTLSRLIPARSTDSSPRSSQASTAKKGGWSEEWKKMKEKLLSLIAEG